MDYRTFDPPDDVQDIVRFWWTLDDPNPGAAPHRLMAETCPNLVVIRKGSFTEADGNPASKVHLAGPLGRAADNTAHGPFRIFGIYLWPWAVPVLFRREAAEALDRFIAFSTLRADLDPMALVTAEEDKVRELAVDLIREARTVTPRDHLIEQAVRYMVSEKGSVPVEELAASYGLARRQFERRFNICTGFSPALFQRILRFQRTYHLLESGAARNLTELALEAGYFDQSHFIRDFKRFGGMDPKQYFRQAPAKVDNFVRLP
jgi:AraC-like DNA-binding protein